jgi:hypothetical protein
MMVVMVDLSSRHEFRYRILVAGSVSLELTATTDALVRLNV